MQFHHKNFAIHSSKCSLKPYDLISNHALSRECLGIDKRFLKFTIPFLMDKLSSSVIETKIESLKTLSYTISTVFNKDDEKTAIVPFLQSIVSGLLQEILDNNALEENLEESVLITIKDISVVLSSNHAKLIALEEFVELVQSKCNIQDDDQRKANISGKILLYTCAGSRNTTSFFWNSASAFDIPFYQRTLAILS